MMGKKKKVYGWEKPALLKGLGIEVKNGRPVGVTRSRPATEQERLDHEANVRAQQDIARRNRNP